MAERKRRFGSGYLGVKNPVFGTPKYICDEVFEVDVTVLVTFGGGTAYDAEYQYFVEGKPYGKTQHVDPAGRAHEKLRLSGKSPHVAIQLQGRGQNCIVPLQSVELEEPKRKLEFMGGVERGNEFEIILQRVGKNGKSEAGAVATWDFELQEGRLVWMFNPYKAEEGDEYFVIVRPLLDNPRQVTFFLPDDKDVKLVVQIPAKATEGAKKEEAAAVSPFKKGQETAGRLFGKKC